METRKKVIGKVGQVSTLHPIAIWIFRIAVFIAIFFLVWKVMIKPLNNDQLKLCKQVAEEVYSQIQAGQPIEDIEIPDGFDVEPTETGIRVKLSDPKYVGSVVVEELNGKPEITEYSGTITAVIIALIAGLIGVGLIWLVLTPKNLR